MPFTQSQGVTLSSVPTQGRNLHRYTPEAILVDPVKIWN